VHELQQLHGELHVAQTARPELDLAAARSPFSVPSTRRRIACTSSTKPCARSPPDHRLDQASRYAGPSARSPASGRALSSAWELQVEAQRR
jgi:hypothetical protein